MPASINPYTMFSYPSMIRTIPLLLAVCAWLCLSASLAFADTYHLSVHIAKGAIHASVQLENLKSGEKLCLPAFGQRYGESIAHVAFSAELPLDASGCTTVNHPLKNLHVAYTLTMQPLPKGSFWLPSELSPHHTGNTLIFNGESLFIERIDPSKTHQTIKTDVHISPTLPIISTLAPSRTAADAPFRANSAFELNRSYWALNANPITIAKTDRQTLTLFTDTPSRFSLPIFQREIAQILEHYRSKIPQKSPKHVAVFIFNAPFDADYKHGFARPNGIVLQMGKNAASRAADRRLLIAHELFHLFNGENITFDPHDYAQTAWFREGVTQFIALKTLLKLSYLTRDQILEQLSDSLQNHPSLHDDPYTHGVFLSLPIEQQWQRFHTPFSLLDFFRFLSLSPHWHTPLTNAHLKSLLAQYSQFNFDEFFERYVANPNTLPLSAILKNHNLCLYPAEIYRYDIGVDYAYNRQTATLVAKTIAPQSPAARAGWQPGDTLIPAADTSWRDASAKSFQHIRNHTVTDVSLTPVAAPLQTQIIRDCR